MHAAVHADVTNGSASFVAMRHWITKDLVSIQSTANTYFQPIYDNIGWGGWIIFSATFFGILVGLFSGFAFYCTKCKKDDKIAKTMLKTSWILTLVFSALLFIVSGIMIPGSILLEDACEILSNAAENPTDYQKFV